MLHTPAHLLLLFRPRPASDRGLRNNHLLCLLIVGGSRAQATAQTGRHRCQSLSERLPQRAAVSMTATSGQRSGSGSELQLVELVMP